MPLLRRHENSLLSVQEKRMTICRRVDFMPKHHLNDDAGKHCACWNQSHEEIKELNIPGFCQRWNCQAGYEVTQTQDDANQEGGCEGLNPPIEVLTIVTAELAELSPTFYCMCIMEINYRQAVHLCRAVFAIPPREGQHSCAAAQEASSAPHVFGCNVDEQVVAPETNQSQWPRANNHQGRGPRVPKEIVTSCNTEEARKQQQEN
mmetsp:Transcript_18997/g.44331  ORF Transcript_18997/g.44331 Transcript_18997/m.44331 type:complete len:205 (+) Transcript_18997:383-997(+)